MVEERPMQKAEQTPIAPTPEERMSEIQFELKLVPIKQEILTWQQRYFESQTESVKINQKNLDLLDLYLKTSEQLELIKAEMQQSKEAQESEPKAKVPKAIPKTTAKGK